MNFYVGINVIQQHFLSKSRACFCAVTVGSGSITHVVSDRAELLSEALSFY